MESLSLHACTYHVDHNQTPKPSPPHPPAPSLHLQFSIPGQMGSGQPFHTDLLSPTFQPPVTSTPIDRGGGDRTINAREVGQVSQSGDIPSILIYCTCFVFMQLW